jgi:DNA repair protein RecO (recombination protein O)
MQWQDTGIVVGTRRHGENSVILEVITEAHGRHLGIVRSGRSRRMQPMLQPGNRLSVTWMARLEEQLGSFAVEADSLRVARLIDSSAALFGLGYLASLLRLLPERDPQPGLYHAVDLIIERLDDPLLAAPLLVRFETELLTVLGFGLDLTSCAATGATQELVYVSPKSGRAVSRIAGEPYRDRMLSLPPYLVGGGGGANADQIIAGFRLTHYFLDLHVFGPRGIPVPDQRGSFLEAALKLAG